MNINAPIRHHYIPRFILRNFCFENYKVNYYNIINNTHSVKCIRDVFMKEHLYDDEINYSDYPQQIEKDLGKFESEIAPILKKFIKKDDIALTKEEDEKIKLFLSIMAFRNINSMHQFMSFTGSDRDVYSKFQSNLDFEDFWKRNLGYLVNCRSIENVMECEKIDEMIKAFVLRDTQNLFGKYILLFEKRGNTSFCIGDCYPVVITGDNSINCYSYFTLSPDRILVLASNGVENVPDGILLLNKKELKSHVNNLNIHVKKIYEDKIKIINDEIIKHSNFGVVYKDKLNI